MSLAKLTDPRAVEAAIAEFNQLGRTAFLEKYGFGRAREYMVRDQAGNLYDSKAIVGAAYGHQHPDEGPLASDDFTGGEATVEPKLRELGFDVVRIGEAWSEEEVKRTVADYFEMLELEARGEPYNKAAHNARLRALLRVRSKASIELKHQNISAVLNELGLPYIRGYKPRGNFQELLRDVVATYIHERTKDLESVVDRFEDARGPEERAYQGALIEPPYPESPPSQASKRVRFPRKLDYAARDEHNRALGEAGEGWVIGYEQLRLTNEGRHELADRIEWISKKRGDGLGYDVLSFTSDAPRYIEVKTTNSSAATPFVISQNELDFSQEHPSEYFLYRVFDFRDLPRLFMLQGELDRHLQLQPIDYRARLRCVADLA